MKSLTLFLNALCLLTGLIFSQNATPEKAAPSPVKPAAAPSKIVRSERVLEGPIVSIDVQTQNVVIERNGKDYPISITSGTVLTHGNQAIRIDELKTGEIIKAMYTKDAKGTRVASSIKKTGSTVTTVNKASQPKAKSMQPVTTGSNNMNTRQPVTAGGNKTITRQPVTAGDNQPKTRHTVTTSEIKAKKRQAVNSSRNKIQAKETVKTEVKSAPAKQSINIKNQNNSSGKEIVPGSKPSGKVEKIIPVKENKPAVK